MNIFRRIISIVLLTCLASAVPAAAEELDKGKRADIEQLLEMTGAMAIGKQLSDAVVVQMSGAIQASRPDLPPELFDALEQEVNGVIDENMAALAELIIPLYHKHFTHDDIRGLIAFYNSELGKKTVSVMPLLMQESMQLGQQWGQALGPEIERRVLDRFKREGVDLSA